VNQRNRVFIAILLAWALGLALLMWRLLADIDPRYRESAEESLVETAHLMASLIEQQSVDGRIDAGLLRPVFDALAAKRIQADIFGFVKTRIELRASVVDADGRVLFDSLGRAEGADFSQWRDIKLALQGDYGARLSPYLVGASSAPVMYVAAPIRLQGRIAGAVSVGKPTQSFGQFVEAARRKTLLVGLTSVLAVLVLMLILSVWLVRPLGFMADYLRFVRAQRSFSLPRLSRRAWGTLGAAYAEMRDALAGRSYVADYVQTLTHELKSPLSAIRGAAELLHEPMQDADRQRFVGNIERETQRIQELVDRMMELAALESRRRLEQPEPLALRPLLEELCASADAAGAPRRIRVELQPGDDAQVEGDAFLLRRAVSNLLDNALDFAPAGSVVRVRLLPLAHRVDIAVQDQGPGIPDYADDKVFEKFYSLARPHTQRKSTGLGLPFVKEIAALHGGRASLRNAPEGGALALLSLPRLDAG
jgi:two-component system sensor histidine kinase CreC